MTANEFRSLLVEVEKHGGPLRVEGDESGFIVLADTEPSGYIVLADEEGFTDRRADEWLGVLKRDLIKRGATTLSVRYGIEIEKAGDIGWGAIVAREALEVDKRWWGDGVGHSELEAVLKTWLAAAKAKGWTA